MARLGYEVILLDSSEAMLSTAEQRLAAEPADVRDRFRLVHGRGEDAPSLTGGRSFEAVLCHGVLMYLDDPAPMIEALVACAAPDGVVSVLALNAATMAVRPALEHRWQDARTAFDAEDERGVLGLHSPRWNSKPAAAILTEASAACSISSGAYRHAGHGVAC